MLEEEGQEPVAYAAEERETLHLLEAAEVDVRPLLLHVHHAVHRFLQFLHALLGQLRVQHVLHGVVLHLFYTIARDSDVVVLHQFRHNLALDDAVVALCPQAVYHLHLQFSQFAAAAFVLYGLPDHVAYLGVEAARIFVEAQHPSNEGTLAYPLVDRLLIDVQQQAELVDAEEVEQRYGDGTHDELLVDTVDGRRQQYVLECLRQVVRPQPRRPDIVKQAGHHALMVLVEGSALLLPGMLRLQFQESHLRDKGLHVAAQRGCRPFLPPCPGLVVDAHDVGTVAYVVAYHHVHRQHVHPAQQLSVQLFTLPVLITPAPVARHQGVVGLYLRQLLSGLRLRERI